MYFIWMLHIFSNDLFNRFSSIFTSVSDVRCKCFSCFERTLQISHLDVSKVDWVLHLLPRLLLPRLGVSSFFQCWWCSDDMGPCGDGRRGWGESFERRRIWSGGACKTECRRGAWGAASECGPRAGRQGASRSDILMVYHINYNYYANIEKTYNYNLSSQFLICNPQLS